ncbi:MAG: SusC/RagA family TonB-linked outer membrane protein, partial [Flammeovirgaceae bacterium]|nr:SusC/RagA family TonB-linked outer membrane protein [Flammeovirgaceae bacterium]
MKKTLPSTVCFLLVIFCHFAFGQDRTISGTLTSNSDSEPLPGVSVIIKGTTIGTVSDIDGNYSIEVPSEYNYLLYSYIGFETQDIEINNQTSIDLVMVESAQQLSEIVVTAFGIEREKKALGYSTQSVDSKELAEVRSTNVVNSLSGKVAGVQIMPSSGVGGGSQVTIRGNSSVLGNNQPLYVIDGVPMENSSPSVNPGLASDVGSDEFSESPAAANMYGGGISDLNPDNIESISVLKGPNAAALYGSRAANGVILVTTKSGSSSKGLNIEYNANVTFEKPLVSPNFQNTYGGGNGYVSWYADGRNGGITDPEALAQFRSVYPNAPANGTNGVDESWGAPMDGRMIRTWWSGTETAPLVPVPDSWDNFWQTGNSVTNNIAISGGNDKGNFRLSFGQLDQKGIVHNNDYKRNNFRINTAYNITDKFNAKVSAEYIKSGSGNRQNESYWELQTWHHRHDDWGLLKDYEQYMDVHITRPDDEYQYANWQHSFANNRFYFSDYMTNSNEKDRILGNIALTYDFTPDLALMVRSGTDVWTDTRVNITRDARIKSGTARTEAFYEEVLRRQETNSDFILSYNKRFGDGYSINAQVGGANRTNYYKRNFTSVNDVTINGLYNLANNASPNTNRSAISEKEVNSLFGSFSFGFKDYLFVDVTARNDWSSTLPADNNSYFYPSVSVSGILTEMLNIQSDVLSFAKLRGSWAQVGNDTDPYSLAQVYASSDPWNASTPVFTQSDGIANSELKPEITTGKEAGLELQFLNGRIGLDASYYDQTSSDQIVRVAVSKATGFDSKLLNAGKIVNKGVELMLNAQVVKIKGFTWDMNLNYAKNTNEVVELAEGLETLVLHSRRGLSLEARVGEPYGTFYGSAYKRVEGGEF